MFFSVAYPLISEKEITSMNIIAKIKSPFPDKFAIPRQSGLTETEAIIVFEPEYRNADALRGIEEYSHLWLIWGFSEIDSEQWSPTVRPPRLGGNKRMGVFATRSPFRPNPIGLSSVKMKAVEKTNEGTVLKVLGADLMDGTPIYDIKPYLPYTDCHIDATGGFADKALTYALEVDFPKKLQEGLDSKTVSEIISLLSQDPRPAYINDEERVYAFKYKDLEIKFKVSDKTASIIKIQ